MDLPGVRFVAIELRRRVDEVLFYVWDPIGVGGDPYARDEYSFYVDEVLALVRSCNEPGPIANRLAAIVETRMELEADREGCGDAARLLLRHRRALEEERS